MEKRQLKYAVIDIGSNSVRLMLWADGKTLYKQAKTTRLGEGIASGTLSDAAMKRTAEAVCEFARIAEGEGAKTLAFATAAVRNASNGATFCSLVHALCGLKVDVVSGEDEADLGFFGAVPKGDGGIIDIGGASTEICVRQNGKICFRVSLPIGCVRLLDACGDDDVLLRGKVAAAISELPRLSPPVYAVGGTAYLMACLRRGTGGYREDVLQHTELPASWLDEVAGKLIKMSVEERKLLAGMESSRADISACGARLLAEILKNTGLREVFFSCSDNLEGYLIKRGLV